MTLRYEHTALDKFSLKNKKAMITGAAWGMRREMVLGLAEMGADIGIFEINIKRVGRIAEEIKELGRDAIVVKVDATNKCEVDKEIEKVLKKFGTINISSLSALIVNRPQKQAHYNVSKAGVIMLTKSLAAEWVPYNIKVNTIASGHMNTELLVTVVEKGDRFGKWMEISYSNGAARRATGNKMCCTISHLRPQRCYRPCSGYGWRLHGVVSRSEIRKEQIPKEVLK